jgi:uncharacterized protein (DUF1697 family)
MRWIILMRAVNVGGTGKLSMSELRQALEKDGAEAVATYIQSGNLVLTLDEPDPRAVEARIGALVEAQFGIRPGVMAFAPEAIDAALDGTPGPEPDEPQHMYMLFFTGTPNADVAARLEEFCTQGEEVMLGATCLYLHAPDGLGRSKLGRKVEKALGCPATARNLNSVRKVREMV